MKYTNYHIKKCKHYSSGAAIALTTKNEITCEVFFDKNCLYQIEGEDAADVNKLWGYSSAWHHQVQSARIGWRCLDGQNIELLTYCYKGGAINFEELQVIDIIRPMDVFTCTIVNARFEYIFKYRKGDYYRVIKVSKESDCFPVHYMLGVYFGGNQTAPHKMDIYLRYE